MGCQNRCAGGTPAALCSTTLTVPKTLANATGTSRQGETEMNTKGRFLRFSGFEALSWLARAVRVGHECPPFNARG